MGLVREVVLNPTGVLATRSPSAIPRTPGGRAVAEGCPLVVRRIRPDQDGYGKHNMLRLFFPAL
jgi:hypothetical protein